MFGKKTIIITSLLIILTSFTSAIPIFKMDCENNHLNCGWGNIPAASQFYTLTHREDAGPQNQDVVEFRHTPQAQTASQAQYYNGWFGNAGQAGSAPTQGATRYIRFWIKPIDPVSLNGVGDVWTDKFIILGDGSESETRVICNLRDDYNALGATGNSLALGCSKNIENFQSIALTSNQWNYIQIEIKSSTTATSNDAHIKIWKNNNNYNSPSITSFSGMPLATTGWNNINFGFYANAALAYNGNLVYQLGGFEYDTIFDTNWHNTNVSSNTTPSIDTASPNQVSGLIATAVSSSQINLQWNSASDNVAVTGYRIYRNNVQIATTTTNSYSNTGLTANTTYQYKISAYDAANNNGLNSSTITATTQPAVNPPQTNSSNTTNITNNTNNISVNDFTIIRNQNNATISYWTLNHSDFTFNYGITTNYGLSVIDQDPGGRGKIILMNNLQPQTTYYYRLNINDWEGQRTSTLTSSFTTNGTLPQPTTLEGDVNYDGTVNILDINSVVAHFGKTNSYPSNVNLAPPPIIDLFDVMIVIRNWGRTG